MEFAGSSDDCFAGYLQEDSDLELSDCSEELSSDEGGGGVRRCGVPRVRGVGGAMSEDEFERDMDSELMGLLQTVASPDALAAVSVTSTSVSKGKARSRKRRKRKVTFAPRDESVPLSSSPSSSGGGAVVGGSGSVTEGEKKEERERERQGEGEGGEKELDKTADYYDRLYFETSSSEEEEEEEGEGERRGSKEERDSSEGRRSECRRLTNEELFYDPHMDEEDEQWVKRQRMAYHNVKVSEKLKEEQQKRMAGPPSTSQQTPHSNEGEHSRGNTSTTLHPKRSDAHLSCPACMTTVCIDCQQHATYSNQFRAMFVMNCRVIRDEVLKHVPRLTKRERQQQQRRLKKGKRGEGGGEPEEAEDYHPVHCAECNTDIAVYDKDEVFHFYNVLASAAS